MPLTRKLLEGMGLEEKQVETIIEAHVDVVNGLKAEKDKLKETADKVPDLQKQLEDALKASENGDEWKTKYDSEHEAFEKYKAEVDAEKAQASKADAYRKLLVDAGVDLKRLDAIMKVTTLDDVELDENGGIKDADDLKKKAAEEWADFIVKQRTEGADPATPPANNSGASDGVDPEVKKRLAERQERLYGKADNTKE